MNALLIQAQRARFSFVIFSGFFPKSLLFLFFLICSRAVSQTPQLEAAYPAADGRVNVIKKYGNSIYLGGTFTGLGHKMKNANVVDAVTGNTKTPLLDMAIDDEVLVIVEDGSGGWYIGGKFTKVQGQNRKYLARIDADGSLNSWVPPLIDGYVSAMIVNGSTLYIGGSFINVAGVPRAGIAAIDIVAASLLTAFDAKVSGISVVVNSMALSGTKLFLSGSFQKLGTASRNNLGCVDAGTGTVTTWVSGAALATAPNTILLYGGKLYVGGSFGNVSANDKRCLYVFDATSGAEDISWQQTTVENSGSAGVSFLTVAGNNLYLGGFFGRMNVSNPRTNLASVSLATGKLNAWNPAPNHIIKSLISKGNTVYVSGFFNKLTGITADRGGAAAFNAITGDLLPWNPAATIRLNAIGVSGNNILVTCQTSQWLNYVKRSRAAAIDATTGEVLPWLPEPGGEVSDYAFSGTTVYMVGSFTAINNTQPVPAFRLYAAAVDAATGLVKPWNPELNGGAYCVLVDGPTVYLGGNFTKANNTIAKQSLAAVDASSGTLTSMSAVLPASSFVLAMEKTGSTLYIGGTFNSVNGTAVSNFASLDAATGAVKTFNPSFNGRLRALKIVGSTLYAGGEFTSVNGVSRLYIAAFNLTTGDLTNWNPKPNGRVQAIEATAKGVYIGGAFSAVDGNPRNKLAAIEKGGAINAWAPANAGAYISGLLNSDQKLFIGGDYTSLMSTTQKQYFGVVSESATLPLKWGRFTASLKNNQTQLQWNTEWEENTSHFIVRHSTDSRNWHTIGVVNAMGSSRTGQLYGFTHPNPEKGLNFYQLVQYDLDNSSSNSQIVSVRTNEKTSSLLLSNPATNGMVEMLLDAAGIVELYNAEGKLLRKQQMQPGRQTMYTGKLAAGIYLLRAGSKTEKLLIR